MSNKNILYLMHVPWDWIKQRPHYLAEELSKYFNLTLVYRKSFKKKGLVKNKVNSENILLKSVLGFPFRSKNNTFYFLDKFIVKLQLNKIQRLNYDIIWITHPYMYEYINKSKLNNFIIYDCMDDVLEFPYIKTNNNMLKKVFELEKKLCENASILICSSNYLKDKIIQRYNLKEKNTYVVNNGINLDILSKNNDLPLDIINIFKTNEINKKIVYIGTISEWFDFDLIVSSLNEIENIDYVLFGPSDIKIPKHSNIIYYGSIKHEYVSAVMNLADILIMPFRNNELIKSVNPVKVYEYIFSKKPTLVIESEETKKFKDFVYLYSSYREYYEMLCKILNGQLTIKHDDNVIDRFILDSTWNSRTKMIIDILKKEGVL